MFVHVFLDLVSRGFTEEGMHIFCVLFIFIYIYEIIVEAHRFFETHKMDYIDQYPADLQQLSTVTEPHHVQENLMAQTFRENKYTILMSSYAFDLLLSFLQDNKMMTMLKFVNQYLNIKGKKYYLL
jgi:transcription initiation factor TFIID subunit 5